MSQVPPLTPPTNPYHIARAYGLQPARPQSLPAAQPSRAAAAPEAVERTPSQASGALARLIAARVPGGVDFSGSDPAVRKEEAVIPFYRHPADRNAAATNIQIGRALDVSG